jgi:hypothetical protein
MLCIRNHRIRITNMRRQPVGNVAGSEALETVLPEQTDLMYMFAMYNELA